MKMSCSHLNCSNYSLNKLCVFMHMDSQHIFLEIFWQPECFAINAIVITCVCHSDASFFDYGDEDIIIMCHLFWHALGPFGTICKKEAFDQHHLLTSLVFTMFIFCLSTEFASKAWSNLFHTVHSLTLKFFIVRMFIFNICCKHLCNKEFLFRKCAKFFISSISTWPKLVAGCKHFHQWVRNLGWSLVIFFGGLGLFEEENCCVALQLSKKLKSYITAYLKYLGIGCEVLCCPGLWVWLVHGWQNRQSHGECLCSFPSLQGVCQSQAGKAEVVHLFQLWPLPDL